MAPGAEVALPSSLELANHNTGAGLGIGLELHGEKKMGPTFDVYPGARDLIDIPGTRLSPRLWLPW